MGEQQANKSGEIFCLKPEFSTTRMVTDQQPVIEKHPEDQFETKLFLPEGEDRQGEGGLRIQGYFKKSLPNKPLVSVITVVFNGEKYIEDTIQSVLGQTYDNVEYIIIDGSSTDSTLNIIRNYENVIDYWVSEEDAGIYDAMNKGIAVATGELIGLINSDDYYQFNALSLVVNRHLEKGADVYFGDKLKIDQYLNLQKVVSIPKPYSRYDVMLNAVHPTVFVSHKLYKNNRYDNKYKVAADYKFFLDLYDKGINFEKIETIIAVMKNHGLSSQFNLDRVKIYKNNLNFVFAIKHFIKKLTKSIKKQLVMVLPKKFIIKIRLYRGWQHIQD